MTFLGKMRNIKTKMSVFLLTSLPVFLLADDNPFATTGKDTEQTFASSIQNWMWLSPFIIIMPVIYGIYREHAIAQRESKGQDAENLDSMKYGIKLFKGAFYGGLFSFTVVSIIGKLFLGMSISDTWNTFMFTPMKQLLGIK